MKYLNDIREDVRQLLSDKFVSGTTQIYEDDELDQHIEAALTELSLIIPLQLKIEAASDGTKKIDLTLITDTVFDLTKLIRVVKAEYLVDQDPEQFRNVSRFGDIITINISTSPTALADVYLYCEMQHILTDSESSLTAALEAVLVLGAAGKAAAAKATNYYNQANKVITDFTTIAAAISGVTTHIDDAVTAIAAGHSDLADISTAVGNAETELGKVAAEVAQAIADLDSGRTLVTGIDNAKAASGYANYAQAGVNNAQGYIRLAGEFVNGASAKGSVSSLEMREGGEYLTAANAQLNIANGYLANARLKLSTANVGTAFINLGRSMTAEFRTRLNRTVGHRSSETYNPN